MSDSNPQPPGWYYAQGDPPGTHRYWDGELWQGRPEPVASAPPPPPGATPYGAQAYYSAPTYREPSQATTALVLAIVSLVICGLLGPVAWNLGHQEVVAIDAGRRDPANRGQAVAAKIIGMIVTALLALGVLAVLIVVIAASA